MTVTRRDFLRSAGAIVGAYALGDTWRTAKASAMAMPMRTSAATLAAPKVPLFNPTALARFVDPLPVPALAHPAEQRPDPVHQGRTLPYYRVEMRACKVRLHRDMPPTPLWGYQGQFPGPTIAAQRDQPLLIEWVNSEYV